MSEVKITLKAEIPELVNKYRSAVKIEIFKDVLNQLSEQFISECYTIIPDEIEDMTSYCEYLGDTFKEMGGKLDEYYEWVQDYKARAEEEMRQQRIRQACNL